MKSTKAELMIPKNIIRCKVLVYLFVDNFLPLVCFFWQDRDRSVIIWCSFWPFFETEREDPGNFSIAREAA